MKPSRRGFLSFLGAAAATATLDPERVLWVPGKKLTSIPKVLTGYGEGIANKTYDLAFNRAMEEYRKGRLSEKLDFTWYVSQAEPISPVALRGTKMGILFHPDCFVLESPRV